MFFGVKITRDRANKKLWLSQESYIEKICNEFGCVKAGRQVETLMIDDILPKFEMTASKDEIKLYQKKIGSLLYASGVTRPDISRVVGHLTEFMTNPGPRHHEAADGCLFYCWNS